MTQTKRLTGREAIEYAEANDMLLCMYNSPIEGARENLTVSEAENILCEDPRLIYIDIPVTLQVGDEVEAGDTEEDYDTGLVQAIAGDQITVAWKSGVRTTQAASLLKRV